jgi:hypothetical protein
LSDTHLSCSIVKERKKGVIKDGITEKQKGNNRREKNYENTGL